MLRATLQNSSHLLARWELNPQPTLYKNVALTIELLATKDFCEGDGIRTHVSPLTEVTDNLRPVDSDLRTNGCRTDKLWSSEFFGVLDR